MSGIWVDTDFGFDDLWALLLLRHLRCPVAGVSLVAGNAPLPQVVRTAQGAKHAYGFRWPVWQGAERPLARPLETIARITGETGMRSRGAKLPSGGHDPIPKGALDAMQKWLSSDAHAPHKLLALGPLTNVALLLQHSPELATKIERLVWMGGSTGPGNHTPFAEYNAMADAEAAAEVIGSGLPVDIVDLQFCRRVTFNQKDMPQTDPLTADLLGGYLDIGLERGRPGMAIYDPLAALALAAPAQIGFAPCRVAVSTEPDETYGATQITPAGDARTRIATEARDDLAKLCLDALKTEALHGAGQ